MSSAPPDKPPLSGGGPGGNGNGSGSNNNNNHNNNHSASADAKGKHKRRVPSRRQYPQRSAALAASGLDVESELAHLSDVVLPAERARARAFVEQEEDVHRLVLVKSCNDEWRRLAREYQHACRALGLPVSSVFAGGDAGSSAGGSRVPTRRVSGSSTPTYRPRLSRDFELYGYGGRGGEGSLASGGSRTPPRDEVESAAAASVSAATEEEEDDDAEQQGVEAVSAAPAPTEAHAGRAAEKWQQEPPPSPVTAQEPTAVPASDTGTADRETGGAVEGPTPGTASLAQQQQQQQQQQVTTATVNSPDSKRQPSASRDVDAGDDEGKWRERLALEASQAEIITLRAEVESLRRRNAELAMQQQRQQQQRQPSQDCCGGTPGGVREGTQPRARSGTREPDAEQTPSRAGDTSSAVEEGPAAAAAEGNTPPCAYNSHRNESGRDAYNDDDFATEFQMVAKAFFWPLHVAPSQEENILKQTQLQQQQQQQQQEDLLGAAALLPMPPTAPFRQYIGPSLGVRDDEGASPYYYCYELDGEVQALRGAATTRLVRNTNAGGAEAAAAADGTQRRARAGYGSLGDDCAVDMEDVYGDGEEEEGVHNSNESRHLGRRVDHLREKYPLLLPHLQRMWVTSVIRQLLLNLFTLLFLATLFLQGTVGGSLNIFDVSTSRYTIAANRYASNALLVAAEYGSMAFGVALLTGLVRNWKRLSGALSREELMRKSELEAEQNAQALHDTNNTGPARQTRRVAAAERQWWRAPARLLGGCVLCLLGSVLLFYSGRYDNYALALLGRCLYGLGTAAAALAVCSITFAEVGVVAGVAICLPMVVAAHLAVNAGANFLWPLLHAFEITTMDALRLVLYLSCGSFIFALGILTLVPPRMLRHSARTNVDFFEWSSIRRAWRYVSVPFILRLITLACLWGAVVIVKTCTEPLLMAAPSLAAAKEAASGTVAPAPAGASGGAAPSVHETELVSSDKEVRHVVAFMFLCAITLFPLLLSPYPAACFRSRATTPLAVLALAVCWALYYLYSPHLASAQQQQRQREEAGGAGGRKGGLGSSWATLFTPMACAGITGVALTVVLTSVIRGVANAGVTLPSPARAPGASNRRAAVNEMLRRRELMSELLSVESSPLLAATLANTATIDMSADAAPQVERETSSSPPKTTSAAAAAAAALRQSPFLFLTKGGPSAMVVLGTLFGLALTAGSAAAALAVTSVMLEFTEVAKGTRGGGGGSNFQAWSASLNEAERAHDALSYVMMSFCAVGLLTQALEYAYVYWY